MSKKIQFEQIEKYLDGSLSEKELADFENQLAQDEQLEREVNFQRKMESLLAHRPEDDFRANLTKLDAKYAKEEPSKNRPLFLGIGLVILLALTIWRLGLFENETNNPDSTTSTEITTQGTTDSDAPQDDLPTTNEEPANEVIDQEKEPPTIPPTIKKNPAPQDPVQEPKNIRRPIAGNFEPNEYLESRLGNLRSDDLNLDGPATQFNLKSGSIDFELKGIFKPENGIEGRTIHLYIFSNKMADYENFQPLLSKQLTFEEVEEGFQFVLSKSLEVGEGLYYYQIEDEDGEVLYLNKFTVNP